MQDISEDIRIDTVVVLLRVDGGLKKCSMVSSDMIYPMRCIMFLNVIRFSSIMIEQRFDTNMGEISRSDNLRHRIYETCDCIHNNVLVALTLGRACVSHLGLNKGFSDAARKSNESL
eukprot:505342_1